MTTTVINDPDSLERQGKLLAAFEESAAEWLAQAERLRAAGCPLMADRREDQAAVARETARRIRLRLVALSGLTETDVAVSGGLADLMARGHTATDWLPAETVAPPLAYQTYATPCLADDAGRVAWWLRTELPELWYSAPWVQLLAVARWLLALRQACWSGRWRTL